MNAEEILRIRIEPHMPDYLKIMSLKKEVLAAVLQTQSKVDDTSLRVLQGDKFGAILDRIRQEGG